MKDYLSALSDFYKPIYGGNLTINGLDTDVELLGQVSVTNTTLPTIESSNLFIYGIRYDCVNQKTMISLSNKTYVGIPYFSRQEDLTLTKSRERLLLSNLASKTLYRT